VEAVMDGLEALLVDVSVNLGGRNVGVAKHLLDHAEIGAVAEQMGGEGMAEQMRVDIYLNAGVAADALEDLPDADGGQFCAAHGKEDFAAGALLDHAGALPGKVFGNGVAGLAADGDEAGLVALACDADDLLVEVKVFQAGIGQLGNAEAAGVEQFHHGAIPQAERLIGGDALQEALDLELVEGLREETLGAREGDVLGGVGLEEIAGEKKAEEYLDGDDDELDGAGGKAALLAMGEVIGDEGEGDLAGGGDVPGL